MRCVSRFVVTASLTWIHSASLRSDSVLKTTFGANCWPHISTTKFTTLASLLWCLDFNFQFIEKSASCPCPKNQRLVHSRTVYLYACYISTITTITTTAVAPTYKGRAGEGEGERYGRGGRGGLPPNWGVWICQWNSEAGFHFCRPTSNSLKAVKKVCIYVCVKKRCLRCLYLCTEINEHYNHSVTQCECWGWLNL